MQDTNCTAHHRIFVNNHIFNGHLNATGLHQNYKTDPSQCIRCDVFFEHGDADKRTTDTMDVHLSKDEMVHYLAKVSDISELITDSSSSGYSLPDDFENTANYNGVPILLERDCFYRECGLKYYASMDVESIVYFDENGDEFAVKNTR